MKLSSAVIETVLELARRRPAEEITKAQTDAARELADAAAAELRAFYYPKQGDFFTNRRSKWKATRKTRRVGITAGGCREFVARALEIPGFRATYAGATLGEAKGRAWSNDSKSGFVNLLERYGKPLKHPTVPAYELGGVVIEVRESDHTLTFSNGSEIELFGADNLRAHRKRRGYSKHVFWIDEAQEFPLLAEFFDAVVIGCLADFKGDAWITGTPGRDCVGMFYDITKEPDEDELPLPGWDVVELSVTDNPFFGRAVLQDGKWHVVDNVGDTEGPFETQAEADERAVKVRWERAAGDDLRKKGWTGDEPDFKREWLGKWVKEDARFVYPVHSVPKHVIAFAPQRLMDNPFIGTHPRFSGHPAWYDHETAVRDLPRPPRGRKPYQWVYAMFADFGYHPDPFAIGMWAFNFELPDVWEMFSWKQTRVHTDDQGAYMKLLWDSTSAIVSFVGDPAGKQDDFAVWQTRMNLPITEANKRGKNTLEEFLADDIRRGRVHLRENSPLHMEMKFLVYLPTKPGKTREVHKHRVVGGVRYGDHCADGARYSYSDLRHWLSKQRSDAPPPGTRAALEAEADREEKRLDDREARRAQQMMDRDEEASEYGGGYDW